MSDDVKRMSVAEFREIGYLQEVNRLFLHPLGLALETRVLEDGCEEFGGVWDYRDDPEGLNYLGMDLVPKALRVAKEARERREAREAGLGYWIQPTGDLSERSLTRKALVEQLLWWMYGHGCCSDEMTYNALYKEAYENGWDLPDDGDK